LPNFRPMLQTANDDYMGEDNRWWPGRVACGFLAANMDGQVHELRIPIKANQWSNVCGKLASTRLGAFQKVLNNNGKLNIVFGGGNSFSHGVVNAANGTKAVFQLVSFQIQ